MSKESDRFIQARLTRETHERLKALASFIARHGWASVGIDRDDPANQTAVLDAAVNLLLSRAEQQRKGTKR
jgi:hypothetical protein